MTEEMVPREVPERPKRSFRRKLIVLAVLLVVVGGGAVAYLCGYLAAPGGGSASAQAGEKYTCGMHPWVISDKPGNCPICQMKLTKIEDQPKAKTVAASQAGKSEAENFFAERKAGSKSRKGERKILFYRNPMNPSVTSPVPMKDDMGMDYVPVYEDEVGGAGSAPEGLATIRVGEEALRLAGVQTAAAAREKTTRAVRTVGIVSADEKRIRHVHTKIAGWIDKLFINFTGDLVEQGRPILSIYSPELLASQEEFLRARATAAKFGASASPDVKKLGDELLESARRRLELFDVPRTFIEKIQRTGKPERVVTLNAPDAGFVTGKEVFEGQQVEPGMELFTVTDLAHVWIEAALYEYEASAVRVGQEATLTLTYDPGVQLKGKVAYVFPYLSPESRTLKVRFDFPNPDLKLKPQMYADVTLALEAAEGITIPDSALIDTGVRKVVFVETSAGTFEPREVKLGVRGEGKVQVLAGVSEGEKVVTKANFLLDSESRLRAALTKMSGAAPAPATPAPAVSEDHAGHAGQGRPSAAGAKEGAGAAGGAR